MVKFGNILKINENDYVNYTWRQYFAYRSSGNVWC
jgi:hypothetical protein